MLKKIIKVGNSLAVIIPQGEAVLFGWKEDNVVDINITSEDIIIKKTVGVSVFPAEE